MTRTVVGLDIGSSGVRATEFEVGRRTTTLRRFAAVPLPEGVVRYGLVVDAEALTEALRELWSQGKFSVDTVVLGVANDGVLVRQMDLEWMPPADFRKGLRYQVADALPVPVDEANLDYYMLDEIEQPAAEDSVQRKVARVMLVAAGREMVDSFVRAVQAAGLRPVRVDLLPFALVRAVSSLSPPCTGEPALEAVVDIGADIVVVVVHQGGRPRFVRTLTGHGGQAITHALMERYEWTWEDAERTKIVLGLPGHTPLDAAADLPATVLADHPARQMILEQVDMLVGELRATLDFYRTSTDGQEPLSQLLLTGRAAELGGLVEALGDQLEVPVRLLSMRDRVNRARRMVLPDGHESSLAVSAGLCLGSAAS